MRGAGLFIMLVVGAEACSPVRAQPAGGAPPKGYIPDSKGCLHRTPAGVLKGLPHIDCRAKQAGTDAGPRPIYSLATPAQVIAALDCDFAAAAQATKGQRMDISTAVVTGNIKFSTVTKDSKGLSLTVAAIPVFAGGSLAPSLEASRLTETAQSDEYTISLDPAAITPCANPSANKWLSSKVISNVAGATKIEKLETKVSFVVTKQAGAGLKLNIIPVSIGPQFSNNSANTQSLSLIFDFTKKTAAPQASKPEPAAVPAPIAR